MPIDVLCSCGKAFSVPDHFAGKKGKCKACGSWMKIPEAGAVAGDHAVVGDEEAGAEFDASAIAEPPAQSSPAPESAIVPSGQSMPGDLPRRVKDQWNKDAWREPWYYSLLGFCGVTTICVGLIVGVGMFVSAFTAEEMIPATRTSLIASSFGVAFSSLLVGAASLVGLDAARHIRATRVFSGSTMRGHGFNIPL